MSTIHRLHHNQIKNMKKGRLNDGGGLWINRKASGAMLWSFRYTFNGDSREMGLGAYPDIKVAEARDLAEKYRKMVDRKNPERRDPVVARTEKEKSIPTFTTAAASYILTHRHGWRNRKHIQQWIHTMRDYAKPVIGDKKVNEITTEDVLTVLSPIWTTKTETAKRVQGRIENILDWATAMKFRSGENPARWRGHLNKLLSSPKKTKTVRHHLAMPYDELPAFYTSLEQSDGLSARALQLLILTGTRTGELLGGQWDEVDLDNKVWTIPAERMKARKEHRIPLTDEMLSILEGLPRAVGNPHLFPGARKGRPLSNMAMITVMRKRGFVKDGKYPAYTPHGFRSSFRDWAAEKSSFPREVAEKVLGHVVGSEVERAYQRGDMFEKRRKMMESWCGFVTTVAAEKGKVVKLRA